MTQTRVADITDAPAIATIIEGVGLFSKDEAESFVATLPDMLADDEHVWIVSKDRAGAAYLSLDGMSADVWNLWFIGVLPASQQGGTGSALLTGAETHAKTAEGRLLLVETSGVDGFDATRAFYTARGFTETARIPDYYASGDDKVIFCKPL